MRSIEWLFALAVATLFIVLWLGAISFQLNRIAVALEALARAGVRP